MSLKEPYIAKAMIETGDGNTVTTFPAPITRDADFYNPLGRQPNDAVVGLRRAQRALRFATSWRGFLVAGCAVTLIDRQQTVSLITGTNNKPAPTGETDVHAEDAIVDQLTSLARRPVSTLALVGDAQPDDSTGLWAGAILPCERRCLPRLEDSEHIKPETLLVSGTKDLRTVLCYNQDALRAAYQEHDPTYLARIEFDTPDLRDQAEVYEKLVKPLSYIANSYPPEVQYGYCLSQFGDTPPSIIKPPMRYGF